ncbi:DUF6274 family protein [Streptomyces sp. NPDC101062]|uniref:DUF6274 family protein n=1 Tax=unclassified Streptomyces TaxID=2593676 RepID=UPI002E7A38CC|nr:DUF6274 family protein [Streptomyces sp. JV176]MEE1802936.1 DUF6274 family protein [Streptomyces sp. JV176]
MRLDGVHGPGVPKQKAPCPSHPGAAPGVVCVTASTARPADRPGPVRQTKHETGALLRAHLAAASGRPHATGYCPVCHRLQRLVDESVAALDPAPGRGGFLVEKLPGDQPPPVS